MLVDDERLVLLHIPKCAGTVVHEALARRFDAGAVLKDRANAFHLATEKELARYRFVSGHLNWHDIGRVPGPKQVVTFLRDPVERVLSLYYFWRAHPGPLVEKRKLEGPRLARSLGLADFLACEEPIVRHHIDNTMVRRLIGRTVFAGNTALRHRDARFCVETAMANLRRLNFVGFQETLEEDVTEMMRVLGLAPTGALEPVNVRSERIASGEFEPVEPEPVTDEVRARLQPLVAMDGPLYHQARQLRSELRSPYPL